jgi:hypothetical protein
VIDFLFNPDEVSSLRRGSPLQTTLYPKGILETGIPFLLMFKTDAYCGTGWHSNCNLYSMKNLNNTPARKDNEKSVIVKKRQCLSSFQEELALLISEVALENFKDLKVMNANQAKRFGRIVLNYSSNLSFAMNKLALDARVH